MSAVLGFWEISSCLLSCDECDLRNIFNKKKMICIDFFTPCCKYACRVYFQSSHSGCKTTTITSNGTTPVSHACDSVAEIEHTIECDWSEHVSPDGDLYYYNCVTCESRVRTPSLSAKFLFSIIWIILDCDGSIICH